MDARRRIPSTDRLLRAPDVVRAIEHHGRDTVKRAIVAAQQDARAGVIEPQHVADRALAAVGETRTAARAVINATGVIIHTNLGRAPLSEAARRAMVAAAGSTALEYDPATGRRGRRGGAVVDLLTSLVPEAGAAHLVNNNAAALVLATIALAGGREIVISKGELVEIGDGFRLPAIIEAAGGRLREVGTTNRTVLADYAEACTPETGFVLKVHQANFMITGYTEAVGVDQLARLDVPVVADLGSGLLQPDPALPNEPAAGPTLAAGADLVTASADKLLGGPQAGLLLGRADLVEHCRRHPLARALRVDKLTLAALEATLREPPSPVRQMISESFDSVRARADQAAAELGRAGLHVDVVAVESVIGGGGAPDVRLPSAALALPAEFAPRLRLTEITVIGRVERDQCLLDLRTVRPGEVATMCAAVREAAAG